MVENKITIPYQIKGIKPCDKKEGYVEVLMEISCSIYKKIRKFLILPHYARTGIRTQVEASAGLQDIQATSCGLFIEIIYY